MAVEIVSLVLLVVLVPSGLAQSCINGTEDTHKLCGTGKIQLDVFGQQGPQGPLGPIGPRGHHGDTGPQGVRGPQGVKGNQGQKGSDGDTVLTEEERLKLKEAIKQEVRRELVEEMKQIENSITALNSQLYLREDVHRQLIKNSYRKCQRTTLGILHPARSCQDIFKTDHTCISGYYLITQGQYPTLTYCEAPRHLCGLRGNWRLVAYINMDEQGAMCPPELREVKNSTTNKRACRRKVDSQCSSIVYNTGTENYTDVCGIVKGYQFGVMNAFGPEKNNKYGIDGPYVDGISITSGSPRQHLWSYAVRRDENHGEFCPCANIPGLRVAIPSFVENHYYCETGFVKRPSSKTAWEDPLWDGEGCTIAENQCCDRYGWFHRDVSPTTDNIEVRWCSNQPRTIEDVYTDLVEIWVL